MNAGQGARQGRLHIYYSRRNRGLKVSGLSTSLSAEEPSGHFKIGTRQDILPLRIKRKNVCKFGAMTVPRSPGVPLRCFSSSPGYGLVQFATDHLQSFALCI